MIFTRFLAQKIRFFRFFFIRALAFWGSHPERPSDCAPAQIINRSNLDFELIRTWVTFFGLYYSYLDSGKGEESLDTHNAMVSNDTPKAAQAGLGGPGWTCVDLRGPGKHFLESLCSYLDCRRREEKKDTHIAMVSND